MILVAVPPSYDASLTRATQWIDRVEALNARYRAGEVHVHVPIGLLDRDRLLEELIPQLDLAAVLDKSRGFPELMEVVRHLLPWPPDAELEPIAHVPPAATAAFPAAGRPPACSRW